MAPPQGKPENVLRLADELIALDQHGSALQSLHETIVLKRSRNSQGFSLEPIMTRFIELCVFLRKGKIAKEGLYMYKNAVQNTSVTAIENVVKRFIELANEKVQEAQARADKISVEFVDDLEASETPESIMMSFVSGEMSKTRTDRALVTPWLKFLWDAYRTVLDILRNNARLEVMYQLIANSAFQFCLKYQRKTEFRRLCELLRSHLGNASKFSNAPHSINLNDAETMQRHLDMRFSQLNVAVELELWQEAFRSIEDIHSLLTFSKRAPSPVMLGNYYRKLIKIFLVCDNFLLHAAAWNRYFTFTNVQKPATANFVILSALSIPIIDASKFSGPPLDAEDAKSKNARLAILLNMSKAPNREALVKDAVNRNVLSYCDPAIRDLYRILEVDFHPLSICKKLQPILKKLAENTDTAQYIRPLQQVILTRLFQQLSQVYDAVSLKFVMDLATFDEPYSCTYGQIEKFIMNGNKKGAFSIRVNHIENSITFASDLFANPVSSHADAATLQSTPAELITNQLSRIGKSLTSVLMRFDTDFYLLRKQQSEAAYERALAGVEQERKAVVAQRSLLELRRGQADTLATQREAELAAQRALKQKQEAEAEARRVHEEAMKRNAERIRREKEAIRIEEAKKLANELKAKGGLEVDAEELENLDADKLRAMQIEQVEKKNRSMNERLRIIGKRIDHLERAYRREAIPLLEEDARKQVEEDHKAFIQREKQRKEVQSQKHEEALRDKNIFSKFASYIQSYKQGIDDDREKAYQDAYARTKDVIEAERERQRQMIYEQKLADAVAEAEEAAVRAEEEEKMHQRREQEAAQRKAVEEKALASKEAREREQAEMNEKLERQRIMQMKREEEAARKIAAKKANLGLGSGAQTPPAVGAWKRSGATPPPPSGGTQRYIPPRARGAAADSSRDSLPPSRSGRGAYVPPSKRQQQQ
ncbi:translation initiation factor eIF3a [Schizosaccharomyces octosporus yFS286]|uniref:Eukaryotic translation initiation factor 3 subunit A n=1 Tax=Schizosaccharomyces octosporus (strain yFS286) TaxID=483514 RepID=S9PY11_SCHOY|nr:translation initiation factor eIF3a [Schizosaccharomyces octosporus yFS286]EPX72343.1 translation initiation factor eIF3a [Schizosaccharomyces octosporus yFS286]